MQAPAPGNFSAPSAALVSAAWAAVAQAERVCRADECAPECVVRDSLVTAALAAARSYFEGRQ
jgi:hypothetical protein